MSAILRACALLARSYDSGTEPNHATLAVEPATATEAAVDARREYDSMRAQLAQARALLERCGDEFCFDQFDDPCQLQLQHDVRAFLARAPAQTAPRTTSLLCYEGDCAKMTGRARPCPVHDAPAQTAEPDVPSPTRQQEIDQATALCLRLDAVMGEAEEWGTGVDMLRSLEEHGLRVTAAPAEPCPRCKWADGCRRAAPSGHVVALEAALQSAALGLLRDECATLRAELAAALARVPLAQKCDNYRTALDAWNDEITRRISAEGERDVALARAERLAVLLREREIEVEKQLAQARALLEHWFHGRGYVGDETIDAVTQAFLARAPAQTAPRTTSLLCYEGDCAKMTGRARPCPVHDAPAQTATPAVDVQLTEEEQEWFLVNGYGSNAGHAQVKHLVGQLRKIAPLLLRAGLRIECAPCQDKAWLTALTEQVERLSRLSTMRSWDAGEVYSASHVDDIASELTDLLRARKGGANG